MRLVQNHERQRRKDPLPLGVARQHRRMQHVGVGENQVCAQAGGLALGWRRVAIQRGRPDGTCQRCRTPTKLANCAKLVLRQRLGGKDEDCDCGSVAEQTVEHWHAEHEALAAAGRGRDDHVLSRQCGVDGQALVLEELCDPPCVHRHANCGVNGTFHVPKLCGTRQDGVNVPQLVNVPGLGAQVCLHTCKRAIGVQGCCC
mmetsp:Transcript_831/g.3232  ORF Transcript_831/g.3232 Transcript_831/m.3232 type:complete len:201 (+) Transcript_831:172-774(+)